MRESLSDFVCVGKRVKYTTPLEVVLDVYGKRFAEIRDYLSFRISKGLRLIGFYYRVT